MFVWAKGDLNAEQEAAIEEPGSVFLSACPGSGKTRTLTFKIARLLSTLKSDKQRVVAITYTHRAADEIRERVEALGVDTDQLWIGTIHAFCLDWILRPYAIYHESLRHGFRVIDSHEAEDLITELCAGTAYPRITYWDCQNYHFTPTDRVVACPRTKLAAVNGVLDRYHARLAEERRIDYELILRFAYELVDANPVIATLLGSIFPAVLIDEYQDTREIQYAIVARILQAAKGSATAFVVGDPNQAIYGALGGYAISPTTFGAMSGLRFRIMHLSGNYRSSDRIVTHFGGYAVDPAPVAAVGRDKAYPSLISYDPHTAKDGLEAELVRLIRYSVETLGIAPHEVCIVAPQWVHLASMTRRLVAALPDYSFDGPGMVPFSRDIDNLFYKLSRIALTEPSPDLYVRRLRWAGEVLTGLQDAGVDIAHMDRKTFLRTAKAVAIDERDGLTYLHRYFDDLLSTLDLELDRFTALTEHHTAFFESSRARIDRLVKDGAAYISDIDLFRKAFATRSGVMVSTIHGVKGAEFDTVIAFALLQGMVPHFSDAAGDLSANKLLYVIASRARKNLHLIAERGRMQSGGRGAYPPTGVLSAHRFAYDVVP